MKQQWLLLNLILFLFWSYSSYSQDFSITEPKAEYDGLRLSISYDLINKKQTDIFYVLLKLNEREGNRIKASSFNGDVGDSISPGRNKNIFWIPEEDAIFLNDTVEVELLAEKYERSFNKSSMMMLSAAVPGMGQTKIHNDKTWWLVGIAAYGTLAGGIIVHNNYLKTYDNYQTEVDPIERADLFDKSQKQNTLSNTLFITAAAIWISNLIWVAVTPNNYKPLQLPKLSFYTNTSNAGRINMLSLNISF